MVTIRREYRWRTKPAKDKTGQEYGLLTVTGFSHYELKTGMQKGRKPGWLERNTSFGKRQLFLKRAKTTSLPATFCRGIFSIPTDWFSTTVDFPVMVVTVPP